MCDTPKTDKEAMWVESGTGEDFQCLHIDESREMEKILRKALDVLELYSKQDLHGVSADLMIDEINEYLDT